MKLSVGKLMVSIVCIGVCFFLFTTTHLFFFDAKIARELPIHGNLQRKILNIPDSEKDEVIDVFTKVKIPWIPRDASKISSRDAAREYKLYVNLVFGEQMFVNLFIYEDNSMEAYLYPWNRPWGMHTEYVVKNPEVLQEVVEIAVECGRIQGILPNENT